MPVTTPWAALVRLLANGEAVEAGVTNRPTGDIAQRTQYLKEVVDGLVAGQLLVTRNVALGASTVVGTPVYQDAAGIYQPALAALGQAQSGGVAAASAYARGMVLAKSTSTLGDVALMGVVVTEGLSDWNAVFDGGTATAGPVYLSATSAGRISGAASSLAVSLGYLDPAGRLSLVPQAPYIGQHTHYSFNLSGNPAGTVTDPAVGAIHAVTSPNAALPGWLPANSTYFPGFVIGNQIPTGAKFGYNLPETSATALRAVFPPIPAANASLRQAGVSLPASAVVCNEFGIWWMVDAYGLAPWPTDYAVNGGALPVVLDFVKYDAAASLPAVVSLVPDATSLVPIDVLSVGAGTAASQGALKLRIATLLLNGAQTDEAAYAYKSFTGRTLISGPVTSRILQGLGASISGTFGDSITGWFGAVTIGLSASDALQGEGRIETLNGAASALYNDFPTTQLSAGVDASPVWSLRVSSSAPLLSNVSLSIVLTGNVTAAAPGGFDWRVKVVIPDAPGSPLPSSWSAPASLSGVSIVANNARLVSLGVVSGIARGSVMLVQLRRTGTTDAFAGQLAIQRLTYTLA